MSVPRQSVPPSSDADLETTAELPVLDIAAYEAALSEEHGTSDTWHLPALQLPTSGTSSAAAAASPVQVPDDRSRQLEIDLRALSESLRDVEGRLTRKGERLAELERELANARAERVAADERAANLLKAAEERGASLLSAAEERGASLLRAADERAATLVVELTAARNELSAEHARAFNLQTSVEQFEATVRAHEARNYEIAKRLSAREQELTSLRTDLQSAESRAAHFLETLQTLEGRRNIFDEQLLGLQDQLSDRDAQLAKLREELNAHTERAHGVSNDMAERQRRLEALEREVNSLKASLSQRNVELEHAERAKAKLQESVTSLTETVSARVERIRALENAASSHTEAFNQRLQEVERLARERDTAVSKASTLEASLAGMSATLADRESEIKRLTSAQSASDQRFAGTQQRVEELDRELSAARLEITERKTTALRLEAERDDQINRFAASEARAVDLERRAEDYQEGIRQLQEELRASVSRVTELEGDLRAAEDAINRLEAELRTKSMKLDDLTRTQEEWRSTIDSARVSLAERDSLINRLETEAANSAALLGNIQQSIKRLDPNADSGIHEIAPEGAVRLLIRTDGDSEVVHVLGRKTTIGRTPDNDLQIDAKFISRNHAVILAGPNHTIIEDLNSTNGVAVNTKRISRHTLRDGDMVSIGKTTFRFAVRPTVERRA
jgi:chromosome segregation ATPase